MQTILNNEVQDLATRAQAQAFLCLSRATIWRLERQGVLKPIRIGRTVRYKWADLNKLAELAGEQGGQS